MEIIHTGVVLGTGEELCPKRRFGALHELIMFLLKARIAKAPTVSTDTLDQILSSYQPDSIINESPAEYQDKSSGLLPKVKSTNDLEGISYQVPAAKTHHGCYFVDQRLTVMYGVKGGFWNNVIEPRLITKEILSKAEELAQHYFDQITSVRNNNSNDQIKLFLAGYSRGACVVMQAINMLEEKLKQHDPRLLHNLHIDLALFDPVPGNRYTMKSMKTHRIPALVNNMTVIYAKDEERKGFQPLRDFYVESEQTNIKIHLVPGPHETVMHKTKNDEQNLRTPATETTRYLEQAYLASTGRDMQLPIFVMKKQGERQVVSRVNEHLNYTLKELQFYKKLAQEYRNKYFAWARHTPLMLISKSERKFCTEDILIDAYVNWPTRLKRLEQYCLQQPQKNRDDLRLIAQLQALLRHGSNAHNSHNAKIIYNNFAECVDGIEQLIKNSPVYNHQYNLEKYSAGYQQLHDALIVIKNNAKPGSKLKKMLLVILSCLTTVMTLGLMAKTYTPYRFNLRSRCEDLAANAHQTLKENAPAESIGDLKFQCTAG